MPSAIEGPRTRLLFIGNSYTARNDLPRILSELAANAGQPRRLETRMIVAGGASLKRHWNAGLAQRAIEENAWDYVVLQEQSTLPVKNSVRYHENVRRFAPLIATHGARAVLYLNWARRNAPGAQGTLTQAVNAIAAEIGALVVPVGPAWEAALGEDQGLALYADDGSHPTPAGSYVAACTFLARVFGQRPAGFAASDRLGIDPVTAAKLHAAAWKVAAG